MENQVKKYIAWVNKDEKRKEIFRNWNFVGSGYFRNYKKQELECKKCGNVDKKTPTKFCGRCRVCESKKREETKQLIFDMLNANGRDGFLTKIDVNWSIRSGKTRVNYNRDLVHLDRKELIKFITAVYDLNPRVSASFDRELKEEDIKAYLKKTKSAYTIIAF